eukprot:SAG22_NODE_16907_length_315_cov_0.708333_1_plen_69_part_00
MGHFLAPAKVEVVDRGRVVSAGCFLPVERVDRRQLEAGQQAVLLAAEGLGDRLIATVLCKRSGTARKG